MAFLLYERIQCNEDTVIVSTGVNFKLAGYNAIYDLWNERGRPINCGWTISVKDLNKYYQKKLGTECKYHFIIDFDPNSKSRIGLIEILNIYVFTVGTENGNNIAWNPLMFRMQDILYEEYSINSFPLDKEKVINNIKYPSKNESKEFVEFLYLNGDDKYWNWGKNGMTNAVFIQGEVRSYFRKYF